MGHNRLHVIDVISGGGWKINFLPTPGPVYNKTTPNLFCGTRSCRKLSEYIPHPFLRFLL